MRQAGSRLTHLWLNEYLETTTIVTSLTKDLIIEGIRPQQRLTARGDSLYGPSFLVILNSNRFVYLGLQCVQVMLLPEFAGINLIYQLVVERLQIRRPCHRDGTKV